MIVGGGGAKDPKKDVLGTLNDLSDFVLNRFGIAVVMGRVG